ncbi:hypothetical protein B0H14DRAFT_1458694 [Mycena olivaceomarginata]|nr:hypothetical protein B0H14DRAFT_1458694 [Mycena olivaceomarginata]
MQDDVSRNAQATSTSTVSFHKSDNPVEEQSDVDIMWDAANHDTTRYGMPHSGYGSDLTIPAHVSATGLPARLPEGCSHTENDGFPLVVWPSFVQSIIPREFVDDARPYAGGAASDGSHDQPTTGLETGYNVPATAGEWSIAALQTATEPSNAGQTDANIRDSRDAVSLALGSLPEFHSVANSSAPATWSDDTNEEYEEMNDLSRVIGSSLAPLPGTIELYQALGNSESILISTIKKTLRLTLLLMTRLLHDGKRLHCRFGRK